MPPTIALYPQATDFFSVVPDDFYQQIKNSSETIISLQYNRDKFLTFKVYEVRLGALVGEGFKDITLQCQIRGATYIFTHEHIEQMSKRELNDLFNHLGIDGNRFC
ncbi:MAG TPA: hypothetical protein V6C90_04535 [Coleofasciculaceae cyanobacterium]|jgi:hypothetical protein